MTEIYISSPACNHTSKQYEWTRRGLFHFNDTILHVHVIDVVYWCVKCLYTEGDHDLTDKIEVIFP